jgi:hexosaminidase
LQHYLNDPIPANTTLTAEEQKLILGGEATMWAEWVSPETIDSRIWPRTAAIAERFWSPREVRDVDDMYRRLAVINRQLEDVGLLQVKNRAAMARRLLGNELSVDETSAAMLWRLIDVVEPVKGYLRGAMQRATQFTPLTHLVDVATPDAPDARKFARAIDEWLYSERPGTSASATLMLRRWQDAGAYIENTVVPRAPLLQEALPLAKDLQQLAAIGLEALSEQTEKTEAWRTDKLVQLQQAARPKAALELMIVQPLKEVIIASGEQEKRKTMSAEEWKKYVKSLAAPPKRQ